jgi:hypothetical protein
MRLALAVFCLFSTIGRASIANLGALSFDTFIPSAGNLVGVNAFNISNLSGAFSLPPDFPVFDNLTFQSATLKLSNGQTFTLGDIGPGFFLDQIGNPVVQVPADQIFQSAELKLTLSATAFMLSDGTLFQAGSNSIDIFLMPSVGQNLTADIDQSTITAQVGSPEPATSSSVLILLAWIVCKRRSFHWASKEPV